MAVSSIGVVAVTPTTAVSKPALEPIPERTAPVFEANQSIDRNSAQTQSGGQAASSETTPAPDPQAVAQIRGTGLLVDKTA